MFLDPGAWPPPPARLTRPQDRVVPGSIGLFLLVMFIGPLAGSSVIVALMVLFLS